MTATVFFRLLKEDDKEERLRAAIRRIRTGAAEPLAHRVEQETFRMIPGAPFAYWVSDAMRRRFKDFQSLLDAGYAPTFGASTKDDFRFLRLIWEAPTNQVLAGHATTTGSCRWVCFSKGGEFSPYYSDVHLLLEWGSDGVQLKAYVSDYRDTRGWGPNWTAAINGHSYYFRPGLTWPRRTDGLSFRVLPQGCVFGDKGPALFAPDDQLEQILALAALLNSRATLALFQMLLARTELAQSYEVGLVQSLPMPGPGAHETTLTAHARAIHTAKRSLDTATENSHAFALPALLQRPGPRLADRLGAWNRDVARAAEEILAGQREIDEICYRLYGISADDRAAIEAELGTEVRGLPEPLSSTQAAADLVSWILGVVLGRFDVRLATGERPFPQQPDPFAPLPASSPGMLPAGRVPSGYPLAIAEDGILVDDEGHAADLVARMRAVFQLLWSDQAEAVEKEVCAFLGAKSLRDYLGRTGKGGLWDDHFRRYSKSRRRAPIYWPLQSPRGLYRVWLYAHRLTQDTLARVLGPRYLDAKLAQVRHSIEELRPGGEAKPGLSKKEESRLADLDELLLDLGELAARIRAVMGRTSDRGETVGYAPDLNDGVALTAAPLHHLIPWPKTRKRGSGTLSELEAYWEELAEGAYDWAHAAMLYWPARVAEECRTDKSLALAHGLDVELFPGLRQELRRQAEPATETEVQDEESLEADQEDED